MVPQSLWKTTSEGSVDRRIQSDVQQGHKKFSPGGLSLVNKYRVTTVWWTYPSQSDAVVSGEDDTDDDCRDNR